MNQQDALDRSPPQFHDDQIDFDFNNQYSGAREILAEMEEADGGDMIDPEVEDIINAVGNHGGNRILSHGQVVSHGVHHQRSKSFS